MSSAAADADVELRRFEFREIQEATKGFARSFEIGSGGFGKVYYGQQLIGGMNVAIKRFEFDPESWQSGTEFRAEIRILEKMHRVNIVPLIGYFEDGKEKILVYKYMSNGTVYDHLHKHGTPLSFLRRLNMLITAAEGLRDVHNDGVIHADFKSPNILLFENWDSIVSDFGLSKTCPKNQEFTFVNTCIKGTFGCIDPNYCQTGQLRKKTDVYAFGVLLLEMVSRRHVLDESFYGEGRNLAMWAQARIKAGRSRDIIDPDISGEISPKCLQKIISIVKRCLQEDLELRATMAEVVAALHDVSKLNTSSHQRGGSKINFHAMLRFSSNKGNSSVSSLSLGEFRSDELRKATQNFSRESSLGEGNNGETFRGSVDQKRTASTSSSEQGGQIDVAVKKLKQPKGVVHADWQEKVEFLGNMDHPNIIKLVGYCKKKHLLVYEYMPHRSLDLLLFQAATDTCIPLEWGKRTVIMIGVARGLQYLHSKDIIHSNLRSRNVLMTEDYNAKLGGLSLVAKLCFEGTTRHCQPMAYEDPEYKRTGEVTTKSDIYCYGLLVLECLTGRHSFSFSDDKIQILVGEGEAGTITVKDIMDPRLEARYASEWFALALRCLADNPDNRPSVEEILSNLAGIA